MTMESKLCENCEKPGIFEVGLCRGCYLSAFCTRCKGSHARKKLKGLCFDCFDAWEKFLKDAWSAFMKRETTGGPKQQG